MYDQQIREDVLYLVFYGAAAMLSLVACCYLLFRRSNAINPSVTSSVRLRRWTAAFFASMTWSHIWYMPEFYLSSSEDVMLVNLVGATLDFATIVPFGIVMLFSMLQDHSRPVWSAFAMVAPIVVIMILCVTTCSTSLLPIVYVYYLLLGIGLLIYMVREVRQYGRWLRDNYADLEHKEVWESFRGTGSHPALFRHLYIRLPRSCVQIHNTAECYHTCGLSPVAGRNLKRTCKHTH